MRWEMEVSNIILTPVKDVTEKTQTYIRKILK
jgi:hypothetical protein